MNEPKLRTGDELYAEFCNADMNNRHAVFDAKYVCLDDPAIQLALRWIKEREPIWTHEQVVLLNNRQRNQSLHPYTCGNRSDHPVFDGDKGVLVATIHGWICPFCDYTQRWAHEVSELKGAKQ